MADTVADEAGGAGGQPQLPRQRCTIVVVDLVESVQRMALDEDAVIALWRRFVQSLRDRTLPAHGGRMVKSLGDGTLLTFPSVAAALPCVLGLAGEIAALGGPRDGTPPLALRVGMHHAEVTVDDLDIYGQSVNLAARLASLAGPGEIVASVDVAEELIADVDARLQDLGDCFFKHWPEPVRAFRLAAPGPAFGLPPVPAAPDPIARPTPIGRPRVAVLTPAVDADTTPTLAALVADELAVHLAAQHSLEVLSRLSTRRVAEAAPSGLLQALNAHYALGGGCHRIGHRVRLSLELVHLRDDAVVWSRSIELGTQSLVRNPGAALGSLAAEVLAAVQAHETRRVQTLPLASLESFELLLGGVRLMHRLSRTDFQRAQDSLEAVINRHPRHPDGYAWLAKSHILAVHQGWSGDAARSTAMARDMARRALDLDTQCGLAMTLDGMVRMFGDRDLAQAETLFENTLALHPNEPLAWLLKGMVHAFRGEGDEAVRHTTRAGALSPLDPIRYYFDSLNASAHAAAGRYAEAVALAERSLQANAQHASTLRILAIAHAMQDQIGPARDAVRRLVALEPAFTVAHFIARSPSADYEIGRRFADAMRRAGVPGGSA